jgi:hypothetical protein
MKYFIRKSLRNTFPTCRDFYIIPSVGVEIGLKEFVKKGVEEIVRNKLFVVAAIVLVALWLPGCGPTKPTLQDRMMEARKESLEASKEAGDRARKWRGDFLNCMNEYAFNNARASASATEIAEGAVSQCQIPLSMYRSEKSRYYGSMYRLDYSSPHGILVTAWEKGEEKARIDVQELIEEGKRMVINIMVKIRQ